MSDGFVLPGWFVQMIGYLTMLIAFTVAFLIAMELVGQAVRNALQTRDLLTAAMEVYHRQRIERAAKAIGREFKR
jgi:hypothetical protein